MIIILYEEWLCSAGFFGPVPLRADRSRGALVPDPQHRGEAAPVFGRIPGHHAGLDVAARERFDQRPVLGVVGEGVAGGDGDANHRSRGNGGSDSACDNHSRPLNLPFSVDPSLPVEARYNLP